MSYEKYIKYKTKYLNLKAKIHNEKIQNGGGARNMMDDNEFIQTLGSTPNSEIYNNQFNLVGGSKKTTKKQKSSEEKNNSDDSDHLPYALESSTEEKKLSSDNLSSDNLPDALSSSSESPKEKLVGGSRKIKKKKNVFSESDSNSDLNDSESSLLSFSSIESDSSSSEQNY